MLFSNSNNYFLTVFKNLDFVDSNSLEVSKVDSNTTNQKFPDHFVGNVHLTDYLTNFLFFEQVTTNDVYR